MNILKAEASDLKEILDLQYLAYQYLQRNA